MMDLMKDSAILRKRTICPVCNGGPSNEGSLLLYRGPNYLSWRCFRDSCDVGKGFTYLPVPDRILSHSAPVVPKPNLEFKDSLTSLSKEMAFDIFTKWELPKKECEEEGFRTAPNQDRLYMPVRLADGEEIGCVLKCLRKPHRTPKSINYINTASPSLHFPLTTIKILGNTLVLLEDILSSVKAALCGIPAAALLGTSLQEREVLYLKNLGVKNLVIALDRDTWFKNSATAIRIKKQWAFYFDSVEIKYLTKDVKDTSVQGVKTIFKDFI